MLAIYTRLSKEDSESSSIENQLREGKAFAKDNGFNDYEIYNEGQGISGGAEIKDRPQLFKLLQDFRTNNIKAVWFRNQNRLERNSNTWHIFTTEAKKYKVDIYFNDKLFDFENPQDNLFGTIQSALNQYQKDLQSNQTKRTLRDNVIEGRVWSIVAYGYKSENGYLKINNAESEIVKEIYNLSLNGVGTNKIADILNDRGVQTRKKRKWAGKTIQGIIKNPLYKGKRKYGDEFFNSPIIIEPNYWQRVNDNLPKNRNHSGKKVDHKYLLKGIVKCGICGRNYYGRRRTSLKENYYTCVGKRSKYEKCTNKSINIPFLETLIWGNFFKEKYFKKIVNNHFRSNSTTNQINIIEQSLKDLKSYLNRLSEDRNKLIDLAVRGVFDEEDIKSKMRQIKVDISDTKVKISNLENSKITLVKNLNNLDEILRELDIDVETNFDDRRELIKKYIDSITIYFNEDVNGYFIEIISNIENISCVYYAPFSKKYAYTIDDYSKMTFYYPLMKDYKKEKKIQGSIDLLINASEIFNKYKKKVQKIID
jgi:DNA invertase Pin-like site-specific DNA recombinase